MFAAGPSFFGGGRAGAAAGFLEDSLGYYTFALDGGLPLGTAKVSSPAYLGTALFADNKSPSYFSSSVTDASFDTARVNVGTGDFTLEAQVYPTAFGGAQTIIYFNKQTAIYDPSWNLGIFTDGTLWFFANGGAGLDFKSSNALTLNAWNDVGVYRSGTTWGLEVNGVLTTTTSSQSLAAAILQIAVGRTLLGYADHIRLSNIARPIGASPGYYDVTDANSRLILEFDDA